MNNIEVRIERREPMRVARFHAISRSPETEAWTRLRQWAEPRGFLKDPARHPVFGFNNPSPSQAAAREARKWFGDRHASIVPEDTKELT